MSSTRMFNAPGARAGFSEDRAQDGARGAALLITLILLALLSAASVAMVLLVSSDTMINGYYRNYRGSFYAADSGVNVVVQSIANSVKGNANNAANPPLPLNGVPAAVTASYAPYQASYYSIGDPGSWKAQFQLIANPDGNPVLSAASEAIADPDLHSLVSEAIDGTDRAFGRLFADAQAAGELPKNADPRRLARVASATLHTMSVRARARIPRAEILPIIDDVVTTICGEEKG